MRVVNVCGFPFSVRYKGNVVVVPNDNQAYDVPDDFGTWNELRVIIPPKPVEKAPNQNVDDNVEVTVTDKSLSEAKKNPKMNKPLKGVKIKKKRRQQILGILKEKYNRKK